jgi:hypothetical protein
MNVDQYFKQAQSLAKRCGNDEASLANTLIYDSENEHPAKWVPAAQEEIFSLIKTLKNDSILKQAATLYADGEKLQSSKGLLVNIVLVTSSLFIGILIGLLF